MLPRPKNENLLLPERQEEVSIRGPIDSRSDRIDLRIDYWNRPFIADQVDGSTPTVGVVTVTL